MSRYTKEELATLLDKHLRDSLGAPGSELTEERIRNLQFYKAEPVGELAGPTIPDRSTLVTSEVADTVEWMLPSLLRVFATSKDAMQASARRPELAPAAKLVAEYLRQIFWKRNQGFTLLHQWFKDALIQKVGFVRVFWEECKVDSEESYAGLIMEQVADLAANPDVEIVSKAEMVPQMVNGEPVPLYDVTIKVTETQGKCRVLGCAPEEMRVHRDAIYTGDVPFIAHVRRRRRNELEADGYDLTNVQAAGAWDSEEVERRSQEGWSSDDDDGEMQEFICSDCFIKLDQDEDGIPEWRQVFMIGDTVMDDKKVDDHDFVYFCPVPMPHTFFGECPADQAVGPQRLSTSLIRAMADNTYLLVNGLTAINEELVEVDDMLNRRPGGLVRVEGSPADAIMPLGQPGLGQDSYQMVEWSKQWNETRTGFTRNSQGLKADALNTNTATGTMALLEKGDQRLELITRIAGVAVEQMFTKMLKCICRYQNKADQVELFGQWITIDPREWKDAFNIEVDVGLGTGSKDRQAQVLKDLGGVQQGLIQSGIVDPRAAIKLAVRYGELNGLPGADEYFPPAQPKPPGPGPQDAQAQAIVSAERIKAQASLQKAQMDNATTLQLGREKIASQEKVAMFEAQERIRVLREQAQLKVLTQPAAVPAQPGFAA